MPDREKVLKGLECCRYSLKSHCDECPYVYEYLCSTNDCTADLASDAIALLKKHGKPDCAHAEHDGIGCLGYAGCEQDDEPIEACKECEKYTGNIYRTVKWDD